MAGSKVSQAKLKVSAEGGGAAAKQLDQVGKATQRVGKEQTRLGQASASAGRQFSSQSQGLGGLVGAYAGAAANIFAITAAFVALSRAAQFEQVIAGTNALASTIGANGQDIINTVQEITKSQLNLLETAQTVNIGLSAGFNTQQIEALTDVSLRASKALGRSLTDAFTRVSRGAAKLEPELLDELGIFTRIDPAVEKYALSVGRSASSLTNFERRQAFVNAVIEEGTRKFRDVDTSSDTAAESLERLSATVVNLGLQFGSILANAVAPFADFLSGNLSNAIAAFGVLATVVGARAASALASGINIATLAVTNFGTSVATRLNQVSGSFKVAQAAVAEYAAQVNLPRFGNLQLRQEAIGAIQAAAAQQLLTKEELEGARAKIVAYRETLKANILAGRYTKNLDSARRAVVALYLQERKLRPAIAASGGAANVASLGFKSLASGIQIVGTSIAGLVSRLFTFVTVISLVQLGLDALGKAFGFESVKLIELLINAIKSLINFFDTGERVFRSFASSYISETRDVVESFGLFGDSAEEAVNRANESFSKLAIPRTITEAGEPELIGTTVTVPTTSRLENTAELLQRINREINKLNNTEFDPDNPLKVLQDRATAAAIENLTNKLILLGDGDIITGKGVLFGIDAISEKTGIATKKITELFDGTNELFNIQVSNRGAIASIGDFTGQFLEITDQGVPKFREGFQGVIADISAATVKIGDFNRDFNAGILDAEKAAQAVAAIQGSILNLKEREASLTNEIAIIGKVLSDTTINLKREDAERLEQRAAELVTAKELAKQALERLEITRAIAQAESGNLAILEKQEKILDKVFSKSGEKLEALPLRGDISDTGFVAQSSLEKSRNSLIELSEIINKSRQTQQQTLSASAQEQLATVDSLSQQISLIDEQIIKNRGNAAEQDRLGKEKIALEKKIQEIQDNSVQGVSDIIVARRTEKKALEALTGEQIKFLKGLQKQLDTLEKIETTRQLSAKQTELKLETQLLKIQEERAERALKANVAALEFNKTLRETLGLFTSSDNVAFLRDKFRIEIAAAEETRKRQDEIALKNFKAAELTRKNTELNFKIEMEKLKRDNIFLTQQNDIFVKFGNDLDNILKKRINELGQATGLNVVTGSVKRELTFSSTNELFGSGSEGGLFQEILKNIQEANAAILENQRQTNQLTLNGLQDANADKLNEEKQAKIRELALAKFTASERFKIFKRVDEVVTSELSNSLNAFFDAIAQGTITLQSFKEGFKDFLFNILDGIRKAVLEETLIKPIQQEATKFLAGAFGLPGLAKRSIDDAVIAVGGTSAVNVNVINADGENPISEAIKGASAESEGFFTSVWNSIKTSFSEFGGFVINVFKGLGQGIGEIFSSLSNSFSGLGGIGGGSGGIFSSLFGGLFGGGVPSGGSFFGPGGLNLGQLFGGPSNAMMGLEQTFGFATGGLVQRYANGGSVMSQDRVPALLQPGEFVMKKSAVNSMGVNNMAMMNATGKGAGNVVVNIKNEGTPQDATASPPRFDGEKFVIDIVTRDLRNNGPIRKSLRGGAA